jgi:hypothetical protein
MKLSRTAILDIDVECRPLSWINADYVSREITAVAWKWLEQESSINPGVILLGNRFFGGHKVTMEEVYEDWRRDLQVFRGVLEVADVLTGHFLRGFDLPLIQGTFIEYGLPLMGDKLTVDTKLDFVKRSGISLSQENLGAMFELNHPKVHMNQQQWRDGNRLLAHGIREVRDRVMGDVLEHIELYNTLQGKGLLAPPRVWYTVGSGKGGYHA